jgi:hypothetical protein
MMSFKYIAKLLVVKTQAQIPYSYAGLNQGSADLLRLIR